MTKLPYITEIARGSTVDGPGIRTVVFLKGCALRCVWCHNPETWSFHQEIFFESEACIRCDDCSGVCEVDAINIERDEVIDRQRCIKCGKCADACDSLAIVNAGRQYSWEELYEIILRDATYYDVSGGGVTFSGGEPLLHIEYLKPLVKALKDKGIHITFETSGSFVLEKFVKELMPWTDLLLYDVKVASSDLHRKVVGSSHQRIRQNLEDLVRSDAVTIIPRITLIPGYTASEENLLALGGWLSSLGIRRCELLSYNPSMLNKWRRLGVDSPRSLPDKPCQFEEERKISDWFYENFPELRPHGALYFKAAI